MLASTRLSTLFQGGIIGIVLGGITVYYLGRNRPQEDEDGSEILAASDDDIVDQQLENVVVAVERFLDWTKARFTRSKDKNGNDKPAEPKA